MQNSGFKKKKNWCFRLLIILLLFVLASIFWGCKEKEQANSNADKHSQEADLDKKFLEACSNGDSDQVEEMLTNKISVLEATTENGETPLHIAIKNEQDAVAELLIDKGANVFKKDDRSISPLYLSMLKNNVNIFSKILQSRDIRPDAKIDDVPLIILAVSTHNVEIVKYLLERGVLLNITDNMNYTPLEICEKAEIAQLLIDYGANVNLKKEDGRIPLHNVKNREVAKVMIENGAKVNIKDNNGETPLHTKVYGYFVQDFPEKYFEIAKLLVENGAKVDAENKFESTPLHLAESSEIAEMLIENGAELNVKNVFGKTPLDIVLEKEKYNIADLLRAEGGKTANEMDKSKEKSQTLLPNR